MNKSRYIVVINHKDTFGAADLVEGSSLLEAVRTEVNSLLSTMPKDILADMVEFHVYLDRGHEGSMLLPRLTAEEVQRGKQEIKEIGAEGHVRRSLS